jgi:hypothetical protein
LLSLRTPVSQDSRLRNPSAETQHSAIFSGNASVAPDNLSKRCASITSTRRVPQHTGNVAAGSGADINPVETLRPGNRVTISPEPSSQPERPRAPALPRSDQPESPDNTHTHYKISKLSKLTFDKY